MASTAADKLAKLAATKADLQAALAEKGQTVGDVFSTYPAAIRKIETAPKIETVRITNDSSSISIYAVAYKDSRIHMIRIDQNSSFDYCIKGSIVFWGSLTSSPSISGEAKFEGFIQFDSDGVSSFPAYTINSDCVFNSGGGSGDN